MDAYSKAFRRDVLAACDSGIGTMAVAKEFGVSQAWVRKIKQDRREFGKLAPATTRQRVPKWAAEAVPHRGAVIDGGPAQQLARFEYLNQTGDGSAGQPR